MNILLKCMLLWQCIDVRSQNHYLINTLHGRIIALPCHATIGCLGDRDVVSDISQFNIRHSSMVNNTPFSEIDNDNILVSDDALTCMSKIHSILSVLTQKLHRISVYQKSFPKMYVNKLAEYHDVTLGDTQLWQAWLQWEKSSVW